MIECLKGTGMPLKGIKQYIDWYIEGDATLEKRLEMFKRQKVRLEEQMAQLKQHMEKLTTRFPSIRKPCGRESWTRCPTMRSLPRRGSACSAQNDGFTVLNALYRMVPGVFCA